MAIQVQVAVGCSWCSCGQTRSDKGMSERSRGHICQLDNDSPCQIKTIIHNQKEEKRGGGMSQLQTQEKAGAGWVQ